VKKISTEVAMSEFIEFFAKRLLQNLEENILERALGEKLN
jgi:hypothetical protein